MHRPPTQGIEGSKPRLPKAAPNGAPATKAQLGVLNHEYLRARNEQMRAKAAVAQMELERRRGLLLPKKEVKDMISYALVCFRQRTLLSYRNIARRLVTMGLADSAKEHAISQVVQEEAHSLLNELGRMPEAVNPESGLKALEREELGITGAERKPIPGAPAKGQQEKAARLREKKTETMRRLRAEGRAS
jgi:hypothetical protein